MKQKALYRALGMVVCVLMAVGILCFIPGCFQLSVTLQGADTEYLEYGSVYQDPGVQVTLMGKYTGPIGISADQTEITVENPVRSDILGAYMIKYHIKYLWWETEAFREVRVIDSECPVIELVENDQQPVLPTQTYEEPGYRAYDNYDGDITHRVIRREHAGSISYAVTDSSGNPACALREIPKFDPIGPEITLAGEAHISLQVGKVYQEPGFLAKDDVDGDLTGEVEISGEVNWLYPGIYPIIYRVADSAGNVTTAERTVEVVASSWPDTQWPPEKTIFLSFDDGPGPYTGKLLDILDKYGVKATFFVVDSDYRHLMKEIVQRGHTIGVHSVSHDYAAIYANPDAYFADLWQMQQIIFEETGILTTLLRFPGGGSNLVSRNSCEGLMSTLTWAVRDAGFQYFDWNVDSLDAGGATTRKAVAANVIRGIQENGTSIVLQHDIHGYSVDAVEEIILWGLENGYRFAALQESSPGFHHDVLN